MWGRIRDIVSLLIFGYSSTERRCMLLEQDLSSLFEKLNTMLAREAKRQIRAAHRAADQVLTGETPASPGRKSQLRQRVYGHLRPASLPSQPDIPPQAEGVDHESRDNSNEATG